MKWIMLRGLAREARHWNDFDQVLNTKIDGDEFFKLDLPGFGEGYQDESPISFNKTIEILRSKFFDLKSPGDEWGIITISLGGMIGLKWCELYPEDFSKIVLINSSAAKISPIHKRLRPSAIIDLSKIVFDFDNINREIKALRLTTNMLTELEISDLAKKYGVFFDERPSPRINVGRQLIMASQFRMPKKIKQRSLVLVSKADRMVDYTCSENINKVLKGKIAYHPKAGHDLPLDDPEWIIEQLQLFK